jgi:DNA-directed RNA polymerase specialized sigma24 family protein
MSLDTSSSNNSPENQLERIASDLYRVGSMLLGQSEETLTLVERVVLDIDFSAASSRGEALHQARVKLAAQIIESIQRRGTDALAAPTESDFGPVSCIEDDDLEATGITPAELEQMILGSGSEPLRDWLESLSVPFRTIFVLRAIAGLSTIEVAVLLAEHGGKSAEDWTPDAVRATYRQALCSLATQLIQATAK